MILFERLGEGSPDPARARAEWLQSLIPLSLSGLADAPLEVSPESCRTGAAAYMLFVAIVGVLGVPIDAAARELDRRVRRER